MSWIGKQESLELRTENTIVPRSALDIRIKIRGYSLNCCPTPASSPNQHIAAFKQDPPATYQYSIESYTALLNYPPISLGSRTWKANQLKTTTLLGEIIERLRGKIISSNGEDC